MAIDWTRARTVAFGILAGVVASLGTVAVTTAGFTLSYDAIRAVGIASRIREDWAWLLPVSVDGAMAVGTVAAVVLRRMTGRTAWYPWAVVLIGAAISVGCNGLHALAAADADLLLGDRIRFAVSAIPAVMLALSVHLLVTLVEAASGSRRPAVEPRAQDDDAREILEEVRVSTRAASHRLRLDHLRMVHGIQMPASIADQIPDQIPPGWVDRHRTKPPVQTTGPGVDQVTTDGLDRDRTSPTTVDQSVTSTDARSARPAMDRSTSPRVDQARPVSPAGGEVPPRIAAMVRDLRRAYRRTEIPGRRAVMERMGWTSAGDAQTAINLVRADRADRDNSPKE